MNFLEGDFFSFFQSLEEVEEADKAVSADMVFANTIQKIVHSADSDMEIAHSLCDDPSIWNKHLEIISRLTDFDTYIKSCIHNVIKSSKILDEQHLSVQLRSLLSDDSLDEFYGLIQNDLILSILVCIRIGQERMPSYSVNALREFLPEKDYDLPEFYKGVHSLDNMEKFFQSVIHIRKEDKILSIDTFYPQLFSMLARFHGGLRFGKNIRTLASDSLFYWNVVGQLGTLFSKQSASDAASDLTIEAESYYLFERIYKIHFLIFANIHLYRCKKFERVARVFDKTNILAALYQIPAVLSPRWLEILSDELDACTEDQLNLSLCGYETLFCKVLPTCIATCRQKGLLWILNDEDAENFIEDLRRTWNNEGILHNFCISFTAWSNVDSLQDRKKTYEKMLSVLTDN